MTRAYPEIFLRGVQIFLYGWNIFRVGFWIFFSKNAVKLKKFSEEVFFDTQTPLETVLIHDVAVNIAYRSLHIKNFYLKSLSYLLDSHLFIVLYVRCYVSWQM